jgi:predicted  nucleic acid-binding Zn-ribbon protein
MMDEKLPMQVEQPEDDDRSWREIAQRWKEVGKQVKDLGERLGTAFKEGWDTETVSEEEVSGLRDRLRELGERMDRAVDSLRGEAKDPGTKAAAKQTWGATREASNQLMTELQESLSEGLREVNKRVDDIVKKRQEKKPKEE